MVSIYCSRMHCAECGGTGWHQDWCLQEEAAAQQAERMGTTAWPPALSRGEQLPTWVQSDDDWRVYEAPQLLPLIDPSEDLHQLEAVDSNGVVEPEDNQVLETAMNCVVTWARNAGNSRQCIILGHVRCCGEQ